MKEKIVNIVEKYTEKQIKIFLFCFSLTFFIFMGMALSYNFDFSSNFNLLYDSDTARVIGDMTMIQYDHYRLSVHPLFVLLIQPLIFIINGLTNNNILSIILFSSLTTSISIIVIYNILSIFENNKLTKILLCQCYLFSYSNIIFTAGIELYNIAAMILLMIWFYIIKNINSKKQNDYFYVILSILGILSLSITITNFIIFLIGLFILFLSKKLKIKSAILICINALLMLSVLSSFQYLIWHNTPVFIRQKLSNESSAFSDTSLKNLDKRIANVIKDDYYNSFIASKSELKVLKGYQYEGKNLKLEFSNLNPITIVIMSSFFILLIIILTRNFKKNLIINIGLLLGLMYNTLFHVIYGNSCAFLYSLHFQYLIILLFGINLSKEKNEKLKKYILYLFIAVIVTEIITNLIRYKQIIDIVKYILPSTFFYNAIGLLRSSIIYIAVIIAIAALIYHIIIILKKYKKEKIKEKKIILIISFIFIIIIIKSIFITLDTTSIYNRLLFKKIYAQNNIKLKTKKTEFLSQSFNEHYKNEIDSFNKYIDEYNTFLNNYQHEKIDYLNDIDFYFLGFGNRKKLLFKDNYIVDIETGKKLYTFKIKEYLIVPNEYSVLIKTEDNKFIKIYEDNDGVHIDENGKINDIEGTTTKINIYDFNNQKYSNIKKVLYSEILFNIKDSVIYPNILVYDKPWYRDAAITSMVLEQTNNTDLISEWVKNINDIYDKQNAGNKEPDNLGELLYIISTQSEKNYDLIDKIKQEANTLANNNPNGYYIYGKTDFADMYKYQNLWYKKGIEKLGDDFNFEIDNLNDSYTKTAWWNQIKFEINNSISLEYPYLSYANRHTMINGKIPVNKEIYPLSWEKNASQANYSKMKVLSSSYVDEKKSPLHSWSASELLLLLLDETHDLKK